MADLPTAVLTHIFRYQNLFELKYGSMLVCMQWRDAANDPVLWKDANAFISPSATSCMDLISWVHNLIRRGITRYSFHKYCSRELIVNICKIVGLKMKCLSIRGCSGLSGEDFIKIVTNSANIESLDANGCSGFAEFTENLQSSNQQICDFLPKLQNIDLGRTNYKQLAQYPLQFLQGINPKLLTHLGLSGIVFKHLRVEAKLLDILNQFCNMIGLNLSFTDLSESFLKHIGEVIVPRLKEINLTGCVNLNKDTLQTILLRGSNLKQIIIKQAKDLKYFDVLCIISQSSMTLQKLELSDNGAVYQFNKSLMISMQKMRTLFGAVFSSLKEINLSSCQINNDFIHQFCKYTNRETIQMLQLASCGITDVSLNEICKSFMNLKKLDISMNYKITDGGLLGLRKNDYSLNNGLEANDKGQTENAEETTGLSNLEGLEELTMIYLKGISDEGFKSLLNLECLRKLSIRGCRQLSIEIIKETSQHLGLLCDFDLGKIAVDDETVACLTHNMKFLQGLNLSGSEVTDDVMEILTINCPCLRYLDISGCEHITEDTVRKFIKGFGRRLFEFISSVNVVFELAT